MHAQDEESCIPQRIGHQIILLQRLLRKATWPVVVHFWQEDTGIATEDLSSLIYRDARDLQ